MQRKLNIFVKKFENVRFCVRPLCELQLLAALDPNYIPRVTTRTWNSGTDMVISLVHFTAFFQAEDKTFIGPWDKSFERGEKCGEFQLCRWGDGRSCPRQLQGALRHIRDV